MQNEALGPLEDHCFEDLWLKGEHLGNVAAAAVEIDGTDGMSWSGACLPHSSLSRSKQLCFPAAYTCGAPTMLPPNPAS